MKIILKRIIACVTFTAIVIFLIGQANEILISKTYNRYYIMDQAIEEDGRDYEVQIFGACHSYTSFNAKYFEDTYGLTAYDMGHPGEIIPTTYLRMLERFKTDVPKVALVEIWGINPYETYSSPERIFEFYMPVDVEVIPFSLEKLEVINDFYSLDPLLENFPIAKYKDRILGMELREADFDYSFDQIAGSTSAYTREEMTQRIANNGFCEMPMWLEPESISQYYSPYRDVSDYQERQPDVSDDETLTLEADILKYIDKIIALCEEKGVELIFYRAPYLSTENELKKANWFAGYCEEKGVTYLDLEKLIQFDLSTDFLDYHHLNKYGARKATDYLAEHILYAIPSN